MNIAHLNEFLVLLESSSFRSAANKLFSSQSTLSRHVAGLEAECGHLLVLRGRPPAPTPVGRVFEQYARRIVASSEQLRNDLESLGDSSDPELRPLLRREADEPASPGESAPRRPDRV